MDTELRDSFRAKVEEAFGAHPLKDNALNAFDAVIAEGGQPYEAADAAMALLQ